MSAAHSNSAQRDDGDETVSAENFEFFEAHKEEIRSKYAGRVIAIIDQEVVAAKPVNPGNGEEAHFVQQLRQNWGEDAVAKAFIQYVPELPT